MVMWSTHLTQRMPEYPGTTTRNGKPWSGVNGSPFIYQRRSARVSTEHNVCHTARMSITSYARRTSPSSFIALSRGIEPPYDVSCSHGATLDAKQAWSPSHDARSSGTPARRRMSRSGAPAQRALAMVPSDQLMPCTLLPVFSAILARRFPAHYVRVAS